MTDWKSWPVQQTPQAQALLDLLNKLDASQWHAPETLRRQQAHQLHALVKHAGRQVPYYRSLFERLRLKTVKPLTEYDWHRIPILTRAQLRDLGDALHAQAFPPEFGGTTTTASGGSTGVPVRVRKTALDGMMWDAVNLRDETWHREAINGRLANLRGVSGEWFTEAARDPTTVKLEAGLVLPDWGDPAQRLWNTGPMGVLQPGKPAAQQLGFLQAFQPDYLLMRPAGLRLLMAHMRNLNIKLPLKAVWTMSEVVDESLRDQARESFGCRIVSNYSAGETGYMALQCPLGTGYHVQSEIMRIEVLDEKGAPVPEGETGRVVVTPLYNYAMPLLRYEIGDEAVQGGTCTCGRGLPLLARIAGRLENYLTLADGTRQRVDLSHYRIAILPEIREFQLAQTSLTQLELRIAVNGQLRPESREVLQRLLAANAKHFEGRIVELPEIPKTPAGKLLQFVSEL